MSKSVGAVVGAVYAKKKNIKPYHVMITPIENAFQLVDGEDVNVFCGTKDPLVDYEIVKKYCKENAWALYEFKDCNHFLETDDVERDVENAKRYVSFLANIVADLDKSIYEYKILC